MKKPGSVLWHTDGARCYRGYVNQTSVKHKRQQWVARRQVKLSDGDILFCYGGTCLADGVWGNLKKSIPENMNTYGSTEHERIGMYARNFAWKSRRVGKNDLFIELGKAVGRVFQSKESA